MSNQPPQEALPPVSVGEAVDWVTEKPNLEKECLLITASKFGTRWEYTVFTIQKQDGEEGWYWGLFSGDGDEWGALEDLKADLYKVLPLLTLQIISAL